VMSRVEGANGKVSIRIILLAFREMILHSIKPDGVVLVVRTRNKRFI
jgi:hypothetical protein